MPIAQTRPRGHSVLVVHVGTQMPDDSVARKHPEGPGHGSEGLQVRTHEPPAAPLVAVSEKQVASPGQSPAQPHGAPYVDVPVHITIDASTGTTRESKSIIGGALHATSNKHCDV
jgi:hypothetical protein